jgi:beta-lactamase superfamily II metal-dependent hydrolase
MSVQLKDDTLSLHILNVGDGDSLVIELPKEGNTRSHIVVDCARGDKTIDYLKKLGATNLKLVVATHPHSDHIDGLTGLMKKYPNSIEQFWDSGFRHNSGTWYDLITYLKDKRPDIIFIRPTSGMTVTMAGVEITVIAPSIYLRNRYDTYGVNINNSSIVMKLEYANKSMILGADAQWDSWGKITEEFPHYEKTSNPEQNIQLEETFNPLQCSFIKVSHHGSKHGTVLEAIERLDPECSAISCGNPSKYDHPHQLAVGAFKEIKSAIKYTFDGSIVYGINSNGTTFSHQYTDKNHDFLPAPTRI